MTRALTMLAALQAAAEEGLEANLARFLAFLGWQPGEVLELQMLEVPRSRSPWRDGGSYVGHADTLAGLVALIEEGRTYGSSGVYAIFNRVTPAVADRYAPRGQWHRMADRSGTSDAEILARRAVYIDLDADRPKGLSATDAHVERTFAKAEELVRVLGRHLPADAIGWGHSGNGAALYLALDGLTSTEEGDRLVRAVLTACKLLVADPITFEPGRARDEAALPVAIDVSVSDRKRLCPAFGSVKAKGPAGLPHRPHRRTAFLAPTAPARLDLDGLRALAAALRGELPEGQRGEIDKLLVDPRAARPAPAPPASKGGTAGGKSKASSAGASPTTDAFRVANRDVPVRDVLARLGLLEGDRPVCPGCRRSNHEGGMVEILGNGLKCSSGSCASTGHPNRPGFRSVVDLVMEVERLDKAPALDWLRAAFPSAGIPERQAAASTPAAGAGGGGGGQGGGPGRRGAGGGEGGRSAPLKDADKGVKLVQLLGDLDFFRSPTSRLFLAFEGGAVAADSTRYAEIVAGLFWQRYQGVLNAAAIADATRIRAAQKLPERPAAVRVQGTVRRLLIDLGGATWQVTADPDEVGPVDDEPVPWFRPAGSGALPAPAMACTDEESAGVMAELRTLLDIASDGDWASIVGWLFACLRPVGPYPLLLLRGEKGSGKSTLARALRRLVDPRKPELKTLPGKGVAEALRLLAISAEHAHVLAYDNLSALDGDISDALCRIATGDGFEARKMYQGRDLDVFEASRPVILTSITEAATRADLLDRSLQVRLPARQRRMDDDQFDAALEALAPRVLGALLWAAHRAMGRLAEVDIPGAIRMRAPARWSTAGELALGLPAGAIVAAYLASREEAEAFDTEDPFLAELVDYLDSKSGAEGARWEVTAGKLLEQLTEHAFPQGRPPPGWPSGPRAVRAKLDRSASALRAQGITVSYGKQGHEKARTITLVRTVVRLDDSAGTVRPQQHSQKHGGADDADDADG